MTDQQKSEEIKFANDFEESTLQIFELPGEIEQALLEGKTLSFKGRPNDELVCCSTDRTYRVRKLESSNTSLLIKQHTLHILSLE